MESARVVRGGVGALLGGVAGALLWGLIAYASKSEFGLIAWVVGGMVGGGAGLLGGRGAVVGAACAVVAVLSISGGKLIAIKMLSSTIMEEEYLAYAREEADIYMNEETYRSALKDAAEVSRISTDAERRAYLVSSELTPEKDPAKVPQETVDWFKSSLEGNLRELHAKQPSFTEWREDRIQQLKESLIEQYENEDSFDYVEALKKSFGWMDVLFVLLGVTTAFTVGRGRKS